MSDKVINVTLPAFAFVESSGHDGDQLKGRNVILHVRSASIVDLQNAHQLVTKEELTLQL